MRGGTGGGRGEGGLHHDAGALLIIIKGYASMGSDGSDGIVAFKSGRKTLPCLTS